MSALPEAGIALERPSRGLGPALTVTELTKTFPSAGRPMASLKRRARQRRLRFDRRRVEVLRDVSFSVRRGEFFAVVGSNGSGKSTLLRCIAGIYQPEGGDVAVSGRIAPFIELGAVFLPDLDAIDNIELVGTLIGLEPETARQRAPEILAFAELESFAEMPVRNYSSGMEARLAFAISIASDADIMLFDEALAVGDVGFREKCFQAFEGLRERGRTVLYVSHQLETVRRFADRAVLLERGHEPLIGPTETVLREYESRSAAGKGGPGAPPARVEAAASPPAEHHPPEVSEAVARRRRRRFLDATRVLASAEYKLRYLDSFLGYLWTLVQPLLMFGVLYFVFGKVVAFSGAEHYPVQLLIGVVLFNFFTEATGLALPSLVGNSNLLRRIAFPTAAVPLANTLASAAGFIVGIGIAVLFAVLAGVPLELRWLELVPLAIALALFTGGVGLILALIYIWVRDVRPIWAVLTRMLFFATPVFYPIEAAPTSLAQFLMMNPIALIIIEARNALGIAEDNAVQAIGAAWLLVVPIALTFAVPAFGIWIYRRQRNLAERL